MKKITENKFFSAGAAAVIIVVSLLLNLILSDAKPPEARNPEKKLKKYQIENVKLNSVEIVVNATGKVSAYNKADIIAEVSGVLKLNSKEFREGEKFNKGEPLLKIDDLVFANNLFSQKGRFMNALTAMIPDLKLDYPESAKKWINFLNKFDVNKPLPELPKYTTDKEKYFIAGYNIFTEYYSIRSGEETLKKYNLPAPFDCVVSMSNIRPGTLVRAGQQVGQIVGDNSYEVELTVKPREAGSIKIGQQVILNSKELLEPVTANVSRIGTVIDRVTQTIKIYLKSNSNKLKDGMYVNAEVETGRHEEGLIISRKLLQAGDKIFTVDDGIVHLQKIEVIQVIGENILIQGIPAGTNIIAETDPTLYEGLQIN